jgi:hypothetical protein
MKSSAHAIAPTQSGPIIWRRIGNLCLEQGLVFGHRHSYWPIGFTTAWHRRERHFDKRGAVQIWRGVFFVGGVVPVVIALLCFWPCPGRLTFDPSHKPA